MALHWQRSGHGPDVVLVHGWGLHGGVFADLAATLAAHFRVHVPDLPGHGRSPALAPLTLASLAAALAAAAPDAAAWVGWSLGGLATLELARTAPARVTRLVLIDTSPKYVQDEAWDRAMSAATLAQFAAGLAHDYRATLNRFLSLNLGGGDQRELLRALRAALLAHGEPDRAALAAGLEILRTTDLRAALPTIAQPALVVHGTYDRLAPPAAAEYLAARLPHAELTLVAGAGHAPFLSHPRPVHERIEGFLRG
jgi:pimeloyl-[acyl-carrier protein] methyl ester esterase